ncbi:lytic transglycosylase domain-containing protein [Sphingobium subterraneum]|uniref:Soluble lytic murein transglycosylase n=1 Tax=Sphingobium subterraneum TaxID=627688 RepID=A0A841IU27_9SPHN|nr:lytic transglycosylase domain-containing protein [Sphingobium subterraneum]MBB6122419.1 soluble lytic murein transglycosylase [Sphingobium subterraneum]
MSSLVSRVRAYRLLFFTPLLLAPIADAQQREIVQPIPPGASAALPQGTGDWAATSAQIAHNADAPILAAIAQWKVLQQSDAMGFSAYSSFLVTYPEWPGEDRLRRLAETSINPNAYDPAAVIAYFARYPARSATGHARNAVALLAAGRVDEARIAAKSAWRGGNLTPQDEAQILGLFGGALTTDDHDARADRLLWAKNNAAAERLLPYLSSTARTIAEARIAMQRGSVDAAMKGPAAEPYGRTNPGYIADRANWLRDEGDFPASRAYLAQRATLSTRPADAEKWFETLLSMARAASNDGQSALAYAIASKVDDAYGSTVDIRDRPIGERDDYTSLTWLAGSTAFYNLGRPRDAVMMFERYAGAARSPQTISKGHYWAGRAALAAGDPTQANRFFTQAAEYPDQFYGQLALERLGRPIPAPRSYATPVSVTDAERSEFASRSVVRAAKALGASGNMVDQGVFLRAIAAAVTTDRERALAAELAKSLYRPDLGVMVGRKALADGRSGYNEASFPSVAVPDGHRTNWTMIHAISRQESQFDRNAVSRAGARGLMQLMPGTARETAGRVGLAYMPGSLNSDVSYNIQLGSTYFQQMLNYYGGSYPLAVAAYNAGPGNVNKWIKANGDPRLPGADILRWIESIPIYETRNYVQRVLENAVVYDSISPDTARFKGSLRPLSAYLGKNDAG